MTETRTSDILMIGAGHNALTCAFYLAQRGYKVTMLESRAVVGGAAVTEEFHPGFRNSTASYTVSLLNPTIIRDMRLYEHGLKVVLRKIDNFLPTEAADYLLSGRGGLTKREIARHSPGTRRITTLIPPRSGRSLECSGNGCCARRPMRAAASATCSLC